MRRGLALVGVVTLLTAAPAFTQEATNQVAGKTSTPAAKGAEGPAQGAADPAPQATPAPSPAQPATPQLPGASPAKAATAPAWFKLSFLQRGRLEAWRGTASPDTYFLNRVRVQAEVMPAAWLRTVVQLQDARVADYAAGVKPTGMFNEVDLRLAFVDVRHKESGVSVRAGRQELNFGDGRLVAISDWGNVTRTFDAVSASVARKRWSVTAFASQLVVVRSEQFDERKSGEWFSGAFFNYTTKGKRLFEPYLLVKTNETATDERLNVGDSTTATLGMRAVGGLPASLDYNLEGAYQFGHVVEDDVEAWAAHATVGRTFAATAWKPRVALDYDVASGDAQRKDGKRGTFDSLYPSNHAKWGLTDRVSWRNMAHVGATIAVAPRKATKVSGGWHRNWVRELADGYYNGSGTRVAPARPAASRHLGDSADVQATFDVAKHVSLYAGVGYFFVGPYLREANNAVNDQWTHYVMWRFTF